jgi:hypothetical protein
MVPSFLLKCRHTSIDKESDAMKKRPTMGELLVNPKELEAAIRRAVREAVLTHARLGHPVATWRDGHVVWLQPDEVFALLSQRPADEGDPNR